MDLSLDGKNTLSLEQNATKNIAFFSFSLNIYLIRKERCYVTVNTQDF